MCLKRFCGCSSRKGTVETALHLLKDTQQSRGFVSSRQQMDCLSAVASRVSDKQLKQVQSTNPNRGKCPDHSTWQCPQLLSTDRHAEASSAEQVLMAGIGIHNAALEQPDRTAVEQLFKDGHLPVSCSSTTACRMAAARSARHCSQQALEPSWTDTTKLVLKF